MSSAEDTQHRPGRTAPAQSVFKEVRLLMRRKNEHPSCVWTPIELAARPESVPSTAEAPAAAPLLRQVSGAGAPWEIGRAQAEIARLTSEGFFDGCRYQIREYSGGGCVEPGRLEVSNACC